MILKESFKNDKRFHVNDVDIDRIFKKNVKKYKVCEIEIGKINREIGRKIVSLYNTETYKFLDKTIDEKEYEKYCKQNTFENEGHSAKSFNKLIKKLDDYNINEGAIVVSQLNTICDGLHRTCILLQKYGPNHKIKVVKVYFKGIQFKQRIKLLLKMVIGL